MSSKIAIKVENVSKDFVLPHEKVRSVKSAFTGIGRMGRRKTKEVQHALKNVSFEVEKGEFFGIVGRNGSGKSTMLKILAQIYQPTSGKVTTNGRLVPFIELGVGFNPELTGRENVYLNGAMLGFSNEEIDDMYEDIVSFAELERFMDQKLKNYSSGMQVRLAFSMATRSEADILLVDEVLAVGDADFQRKCFEYFRALKRNKKTVVFVSHDMSAVREYCDRAVLIEKSEVVHLGTASEVASLYTKMFLEEAVVTEGTGTDDAKRWGSQHVVVEEVLVSPKKLSSKQQELNIRLEIVAQRDVNDVNVGYSVTSAAGQSVTGTNTKIQNSPIGSLKANDRISVEFVMPNIFADGKYFVNTALASNDGNVYDWWDEADAFNSYEEVVTGHVASTYNKVTIKRR